VNWQAPDLSQSVALVTGASRGVGRGVALALGDAAAMPTISIVKKWRNEFEDHLQGKCSYKPAEMIAGAH